MAEVFINQSASFAKKFNLSGFFVGFLLVSFGTCLPELTTSIYSVTLGHQEIAISSVIGSYISNIFLVLGFLALLRKYKLKKRDTNFNIPLLLLITFGSLLLLVANVFVTSVFVGVLFVCIFLIAAFIVNKNNHSEKQFKIVKLNYFFLVGSLALIILFSRICIDSILKVTTQLNLPEVLIGYFILALGTSLPEFITLLTSLKMGREDIGLGNLVGSNMFNILFIPGILSFIAPLDFAPFQLELVFVFFAAVLLFIFGLIGKKYFISRREGFVLLLLYLVFILIQVFRNL